MYSLVLKVTVTVFKWVSTDRFLGPDHRLYLQLLIWPPLLQLFPFKSLKSLSNWKHLLYRVFQKSVPGPSSLGAPQYSQVFLSKNFQKANSSVYPSIKFIKKIINTMFSFYTKYKYTYVKCIRNKHELIPSSF